MTYLQNTVEAMTLELDRLSQENQKLREGRHVEAVKNLRKFKAGDATIYVPTGMPATVKRYIPNGLVDVVFEDRPDFIKTVHCSHLIPRRDNLNISYDAVMKLIAIAESLQSEMYGVTDHLVTISQIDDALGDIRGREQNDAIINRLKRKEPSCQ